MSDRRLDGDARIVETAPCARPGCGVLRVRPEDKPPSWFARHRFCSRKCAALANAMDPRCINGSEDDAPPHICECGCGCEVPKKEGEKNWRWRKRRYASESCRRRGAAMVVEKRRKTRFVSRYDGGAQNPAEVMGARPNLDLNNLPADEGRLWT